MSAAHLIPLLPECLLDVSGYLENELNTSTSGIKSKREIQKVTEEILNNNELSASGQMLQQLEFERAKTEILENELSGITFTFQSSPTVLTLSEIGAKRLGISQVISDPLNNPDIQNNSNESLKHFIDEISHATAAAPDVSLNGHIFADGALTDCEFRCKTLWVHPEKPAYIGTVGMIFLK